MGNASEQRLTLIHRVIVPDTGYPKEYAILVTDRRSIFIRQPKSRSNFWLEGEMRWGTALVTDVVPKNLEDYAKSSLDSLSSDPTNIAISHGSVISVAMKADKPTFRRREFFVRLTMKRQKEIFQVYNFEFAYFDPRNQASELKFYAVPLGSYFKPRRQVQSRESILREYAEGILAIFRSVLPSEKISP